MSVPFLPNNYNPQYFKDPQEFNPERWESEEIKKIPTHAYGGFGGGARSCIGKHFGMLENKVAITKFMKRYNYEMTDKVLKMKWNLMTGPQKIYLKLEKRSK